MPSSPSHRAAVLFAAGLAAACATAPSTSTNYEREVALSADVAAAVSAGALRHLLAFADPVPQAAGAPAEALSGGGFAVVYERACDGGWVPRAGHRLAIAEHGVDVELLRGALALPGLGARTRDRIELRIDAANAGAVVRASLPAGIAAEARQALDRAFALALEPDARCAGLDEPNLARLVSRRSRLAADAELAAGAPVRAEGRLLEAARLAPLPAAAQHRLAEFAAQRGDLELARARLLEALLRARGPAARGAAAAGLAALRQPLTGLTALERERPLPSDDAALAIAAARLHTVRRLHPAPALDYEMASRLHRQRADELAALASALLAREHRLGGTAVAGFAPPMRGGLEAFVRRTIRGDPTPGLGFASGGDAPDRAAAPGR